MSEVLDLLVFSAILTTSLLAAGKSDQLPVSGFYYGGRSIASPMAAFCLFFPTSGLVIARKLET